MNNLSSLDEQLGMLLEYCIGYMFAYEIWNFVQIITHAILYLSSVPKYVKQILVLYNFTKWEEILYLYLHIFQKYLRLLKYI